MASQAMVQIVADTSGFETELVRELRAIIRRVEAGLPPITIHVRLDDEAARRQINNLTANQRRTITVRANADTKNAITNLANFTSKIVAAGAAAIPALGAVVGAVGGLTKAFGAAAVGAAAFTAAIIPQVKHLTEVQDAADKLADAQTDAANKKALADKLDAQGSDLAEKAQKAATSSRLAAITAENAFVRATKDIPPATAATAVALAKLKDENEKWSDSLASTTMPLFTRGINILRKLLPDLTPLVKTVAAQIDKLLDSMEKGVDSGGFAKFIDRTNETIKTTLPSLLRSIRNIIKGVGGIGKAFNPVTKGVVGGFEEMTESFAKWGEGLQKNEKFQEFLARFNDNGGQLSETLGNLALIIANVLVALGPFSGTVLQIAVALSSMIAAVPPGIITTLAYLFTTWAIAMKLYATYTALATAATWLNNTANIAARASIALLYIEMAALRIATIASTAATVIATAATWAWGAAIAFVTSPIGIVILAVVALIAIIVLIVKNLDFFKKTWGTVWNFVKNTTVTVWNAIRNFLSATWTWIKNAWTTTLNAIKSAASAAWTWIRNVSSTAWNAIKNTIIAIFTNTLTGIRNVIGSITKAVGGVKDKIVKYFSGAGKWLYNSGKALIQGFMNGIGAMAQKAYNKVLGVVKNIRNLWPFSPAKEGPFSGRGYTTYSGKALMEGFLQGIQGAAPRIQAGINGVLSSLPSIDATTVGNSNLNTPQTMRSQPLTPVTNNSFNPTISVTIGNQAVDRYVDTRIDRNNASRDRRTAQGVRL